MCDQSDAHKDTQMDTERQAQASERYQQMERVHELFHDPEDMFGSMFGRMHRMFEMDDLMNGRQGNFARQTYGFTATKGADGQMHTEKFASSAVGNTEKQMQEVQEMYSNSQSGEDRMSLERQLGSRGRKMVKARTGQDQRTTNLFKGMEEKDTADFDHQWTEAEVSLPWRFHIPQAMDWRAPALTGAPRPALAGKAM
eukprot:CAMPEP_0181450982 /NCGR_PEP_ID=MMETSP1110-20121109/28456_1 /TAXON_ID=174948 /ORGANISM="Symbiodinium sp., Strain CCMP421" /LENGTH=197 /DNA_ID=CAMNT_0023575219 /DNA_START=68 /DNA_END=661 /DNA_ORIENTATION=-